MAHSAEVGSIEFTRNKVLLVLGLVIGLLALSVRYTQGTVIVVTPIVPTIIVLIGAFYFWTMFFATAALVVQEEVGVNLTSKYPWITYLLGAAGALALINLTYPLI